MLPFRAGSSAEIFKAILDAPAPALRLNPGLPAELERIMDKAMEKDRNLRYQSAAEVRADLQPLKQNKDSGRSAATISAGRAELSPTGWTDGLSGAAVVSKLGRPAWKRRAVAVGGFGRVPRRDEWALKCSSHASRTLRSRGICFAPAFLGMQSVASSGRATGKREPANADVVEGR